MFFYNVGLEKAEMITVGFCQMSPLGRGKTVESSAYARSDYRDGPWNLSGVSGEART